MLCRPSTKKMMKKLLSAPVCCPSLFATEMRPFAVGTLWWATGAIAKMITFTAKVNVSTIHASARYWNGWTRWYRATLTNVLMRLPLPGLPTPGQQDRSGALGVVGKQPVVEDPWQLTVSRVQRAPGHLGRGPVVSIPECGG